MNTNEVRSDIFTGTASLYQCVHNNEVIEGPRQEWLRGLQ